MKKLVLFTFLFILIANIMNAQVLKGSHWSAKKVNDVYIVSIEDKASLVDAITDFVKTQKITAGQITGIGAVNEVTLRFFDPTTKKYIDKNFKEQMEVSNFSGNISEAEGKPLIHLHGTFGRRDYTALAGHVLDTKVRGAGELFVYPIDTKVIKVKDPNIGLNIYDFDK